MAKATERTSPLQQEIKKTSEHQRWFDAGRWIRLTCTFTRPRSSVNAPASAGGVRGASAESRGEAMLVLIFPRRADIFYCCQGLMAGGRLTRP